MKTIGVAIAVLIATLVAPIAHADGIVIKMPTKVNMFKELMLEKGMDLSGTDESDGHVENNGSGMKVITYAPVTDEQLEWIKECAVEAVRK